ncbi:MAG: nucleoside hydrolase [Polyangiaceae bacterium]
MTRPFLIDTDTASDDAVALLMALAAEDVSVEAITVVAGNVPLAQGSANARFTVELAGRSVPVYEGAAAPLLREPLTAEWFHGRDGLGDRGYGPPRNAPAPGHAVDVIIETARRCPGLTLVTLGPLTNVALALAKAPDIAEKIGRAVVMGGAACTVGNVTPAAEYNIWCDPEAARMCFRSRVPIEMVGWELCRGRAVLDAADIARVEALGTEAARFAIGCNQHALEVNRSLFHEDGIGLPDPIAMAVAIDPSLVTKKSAHLVDVECEGALTRGMTVVDHLDVVRGGLAKHSGFPLSLTSRPPNVTVCWEIDVERWKALLLRCLAR